ncbi:MAG TPA: hypothetical protein VEA16_19685 [Vicinamibacterales bacterium]|nr:hypothetical protein [Vicinamibacterales bacterium]
MRLLLSVALSAALFASTAFAARMPDGGPRIRPQDNRIKQVLQEGVERSATFKALVDRIEAGDVIVYVAVNPLLKSSLSGALTWMTQAGGFRYVRASISSDLLFDQMIATVAHELQHALEVIGDTSVRDEKTLIALYRRIGHENPNIRPLGWETVAAQETGWKVRREIASVPAAALSRTGAWTRS